MDIFLNTVVYGIYDVNIDNFLVSVKKAPRIALCAASWLGEKLASKAINVEVIIEIKKREIKGHVYAKRQMWICTTWTCFLLNCRLLVITFTPK